MAWGDAEPIKKTTYGGVQAPTFKKPRKQREGPPPPYGFNKPMRISPELQDLLGTSENMSRPQVVKRIWQYVKANNLQVPEDRRQIYIDEKLSKVFVDMEFVSGFAMNSHLKNHIFPLTPADQGVAIENPIGEGAGGQ